MDSKALVRKSGTNLVSVSTEELERALTSRRLGAQIAGAHRRFFPELLERPLTAILAYQTRQPLLQFCYSVKTNPAPAVLSKVRGANVWAEVISPEELGHARQCGFPLSKIVYNGPYPAQYCELPPAYAFADSIEAYIGAAQRFEESMVGVRMRPTGIASRFGLSLDRLGELVQAVSTCGRREIGISFHVRPEDYGSYTFRTLAEAAVDWATEVERRSGARVVVLDVGGGKRPCELDDVISNGDFEWLQAHSRSRLPHIRAILAEPGQAIVTSCETVIARILEVRRTNGRVEEVVIDAGYPELPQLRSFQHRIFLLSAENVRALGKGGGRIVGRTCLEYDVVASNADLEGCGVNDAIAVADAGAYDASMAFIFAQGSRRA